MKTRFPTIVVNVMVTFALTGLLSDDSAWAQQPERASAQSVSRPKPVWTPTADAPKGAISPGLESQHHDQFIERAKAGDIDIVFFGTTDTEMWNWRDRGLTVWNRRFASRRAANFGSQGTRLDTLLWRMRNGELDGYQASLVVLQLAGPGGHIDGGSPGSPDVIAEYAAIVAEVRARQPQARILLFAPFPRGAQALDAWRPISQANAAAVSRLVDNKTVVYIDIGERFFLPDGSHNQEMWRFPPLSGGVNVGTQTSTFEAWADAIEPFLNRGGR